MLYSGHANETKEIIITMNVSRPYQLQNYKRRGRTRRSPWSSNNISPSGKAHVICFCHVSFLAVANGLVLPVRPPVAGGEKPPQRGIDVKHGQEVNGTNGHIGAPPTHRPNLVRTGFRPQLERGRRGRHSADEAQPTQGKYTNQAATVVARQSAREGNGWSSTETMSTDKEQKALAKEIKMLGQRLDWVGALRTLR